MHTRSAFRDALSLLKLSFNLSPFHYHDLVSHPTFSSRRDPTVSENETKADEILRRNGWIRVPVLGDGNCFYRCIAILHLRDESKHVSIRRHCADYYTRNATIPPGLTQQSINAMRNLGNYSGEEDFLACGAVLTNKNTKFLKITNFELGKAPVGAKSGS